MHLHINVKHTYNCIVLTVILVGLSNVWRNAHTCETDHILEKA